MQKLEKYIEDKRFIKWVFNPDDETNSYFQKYQENYPEEKERLYKLRKELKLLSVSETKVDFNKGVEIYHSILNKIQAQKPNTFQLGTFVKYAAIAVLFFAIGSILVYLSFSNHATMQFSEEYFLKGANYHPVLYFSDGHKKEIVSVKQSVDLSHPGWCIVGEDTLKMSTTNAEKSGYNLLVVPFGQRLQVLLEDQSKVWLNAGSRLIFPSTFSKKERQIYLAGEGFFDVAHNPQRPFWVNTSSIAVKVLGTKFNVSAYAEDLEVVTTLQEGKVQIVDRKSLLSEIKTELKPDQVANYNKLNKKVQVTAANHELNTLWKDGFLRFENLFVSQLIKKIERYYNIQIEFAGAKTHNEIVRGTLDLNADMTEVLEYLSILTHAEIKKINNSTYILE